MINSQVYCLFEIQCIFGIAVFNINVFISDFVVIYLLSLVTYYKVLLIVCTDISYFSTVVNNVVISYICRQEF